MDESECSKSTTLLDLLPFAAQTLIAKLLRFNPVNLNDPSGWLLDREMNHRLPSRSSQSRGSLNLCGKPCLLPVTSALFPAGTERGRPEEGAFNPAVAEGRGGAFEPGPKG